MLRQVNTSTHCMQLTRPNKSTSQGWKPRWHQSGSATIATRMAGKQSLCLEEVLKSTPLVQLSTVTPQV